MSPNHLARASLAILSLAALAACADGPTGTPSANSMSAQHPVAQLATQTPLGGELWICKAANVPGTFHFTVAYTHTNNVGTALPADLALTSTDVAEDACVQVASTPNSGTSGATYTAVITETFQTDWTLDAISAIKSDGNPVTIATDLATGTASGSSLKFGNDRGTTVVFTNTYHPPGVTPEGCSPGYYKKHVQPGSDQLLGDIFTSTPGALAGLTLQQALFLEGGSTLLEKEQILLRQAAAGYLNIGYLGAPPYPLTLTQLQNLVNDALDSGDATTILSAKDQIAGYNNLDGPKC
jgi:hypothetical protein